MKPKLVFLCGKKVRMENIMKVRMGNVRRDREKPITGGSRALSMRFSFNYRNATE